MHRDAKLVRHSLITLFKRVPYTFVTIRACLARADAPGAANLVEAEADDLDPVTTLSQWEDLLLVARPVYMQLVDAERVPATHLITMRLLGTKQHASVTVARFVDNVI